MPTERRALSGLFARAGAVVLFAVLACAAHASAQSGVVRGAVTTAGGSVALPGAAVSVTRQDTHATVARTVTDDRGEFRVSGLAPGTYTVHAALDGFADQDKTAVVADANPDSAVSFDLDIARVSEKVDVTAPDVRLESSPAEHVKGSDLLVGPIRGDNFQALLPTVPGVIRGLDGHISINGGTATQSSVQLDAANVTDPSTGNVGFDLPNDAVESVDVQTNPYAAEFGRFSSGVMTLNTTHGGAKWSVTPNGFVPRLYRSQNNWWDIQGIRSFRPRVAISGPLVADKVFFFENILYRYFRIPIIGLRDDESPTTTELKTFTRLDANLSPKNAGTITVATFPQQVQYANLNEFNRKEVSTNFHQSGFNVALSDRATLSEHAFLESTVAVKRYDVQIDGQGILPMGITPDGNIGNYYNRQTRNSMAYQWVESLTTSGRWLTGEHLLKFGTDVLQVGYDGTSASSPVLVYREDGTLIQRIEFGPAGPFGSLTRQNASSTEAAAIAQDRWRLNDRLLAEFGGRVDRDGVLGRVNLTPRLGGAFSLVPSGDAIVRGGIGLFYDRTPLNVGAFESFEPRTITTYAADGQTPIGTPVAFVNRADSNLQTPYSRTWNVEYDQRVNRQWSFKLNYVDRAGHNEFIVNPVTATPTPELLLTSSGQSRYREAEVSFRFTANERADTVVSYVRSRAMADLNAYDLFFGNSRNPIINPNQYGPMSTDVPNRVLVRGTYRLPWKLSFEPLLDFHSGFPYSTIAEDQSIIGQQNGAGRFPIFATFDFSVSRPVKIWKYKATLGLRMFDTTDRFNPRDAQRNIASPAFGGFYNPVPFDFQTFVELGR